MADGDKWQTDEDITTERMNVKNICVGTTAPASPTDGMVWIDTSLNPPTVKIYDSGSSSWKLAITNLTQITTRSHAALSSVNINDHHNKVHTHTEHSFGEAEVIANKWAANGYPALDANQLCNPLKTVVSDNLRSSNDAEVGEFGTDYYKRKEIRLDEPLEALRIKFDLKSEDGVTEVKGRIYKNGVAIGTEKTRTSNSYLTFSQDFAGPFAKDDLIQLYLAGGGTPAQEAFARNFRLYYDLNPVKAATNTLT